MNPLWRFSLSRYRYPGVAALSMPLQDDYGLNINVLLCAVWLAHCDHPLTVQELATVMTAITPWDREVVWGLRRVRRALKGLGQGDGSAEEIKHAVAELELRAEQHCVQQIWQHFRVLQQKDLGTNRLIGLALDNLRCYRDFSGQGQQLDKPLQRWLTAVLACEPAEFARGLSDWGNKKGQ